MMTADPASSIENPDRYAYDMKRPAAYACPCGTGAVFAVIRTFRAQLVLKPYSCEYTSII